MRNTFLVKILAGSLFLVTGALAQPTQLQGTLNTPRDVEVVSRDGHQFLKFGSSFSVESQAECVVQHVDGQTGKITKIGQLVSKKGYQVYEVPEGLVIDGADQIVVYSPLIADDLATVELLEDTP